MGPRKNFDSSVKPPLHAARLKHREASLGASTFKFYSQIGNFVF